MIELGKQVDYYGRQVNILLVTLLEYLPEDFDTLEVFRGGVHDKVQLGHHLLVWKRSDV